MSDQSHISNIRYIPNPKREKNPLFNIFCLYTLNMCHTEYPWTKHPRQHVRGIQHHLSTQLTSVVQSCWLSWFVSSCVFILFYDVCFWPNPDTRYSLHTLHLTYPLWFWISFVKKGVVMSNHVTPCCFMFTTRRYVKINKRWMHHQNPRLRSKSHQNLFGCKSCIMRGKASVRRRGIFTWQQSMLVIKHWHGQFQQIYYCTYVGCFMFKKR